MITGFAVRCPGRLLFPYRDCGDQEKRVWIYSAMAESYVEEEDELLYFLLACLYPKRTQKSKALLSGLSLGSNKMTFSNWRVLVICTVLR